MFNKMLGVFALLAMAVAGSAFADETESRTLLLCADFQHGRTVEVTVVENEEGRLFFNETFRNGRVETTEIFSADFERGGFKISAVMGYPRTLIRHEDGWAIKWGGDCGQITPTECEEAE